MPGEGDHLARFLTAYANGAICRVDMEAVFRAALVITRYRMVVTAELAGEVAR